MRRRKSNHSEIDYWQSNTDLITGFVLVLFLIIMLLILYLVQIPENALPDAVSGNSFAVDDQPGDTVEDDETDTRETMGGTMTAATAMETERKGKRRRKAMNIPSLPPQETTGIRPPFMRP